MHLFKQQDYIINQALVTEYIMTLQLGTNPVLFILFVLGLSAGVMPCKGVWHNDLDASSTAA